MRTRTQSYSVKKFMASSELFDDKVWSVANAFFEKFGFVQHQIDSYNYAIERAIPDLIMRTKCDIKDDKGHIVKTIQFSNVKYDNPHTVEMDDTKREYMTPAKCTLRELTYSSNMTVDVIETRIENGISLKPICTPNIFIGSIPVMVKSCLCNLKDMPLSKIYENGEDPSLPGGYFVIKGSEKIIVAQERQANNRIYTFEGRRTHPHFDLFTEVRSNPHGTTHITLTQVGLFLNKEESIGIILPYLVNTTAVPLLVLFAALGITDKRQVAQMCCPSPEAMEFLLASLEIIPETTQEEAIKFIGTCGRRFAEDDEVDMTIHAETFAEHVLVDELFHHVSGDVSTKEGREQLLLRKAYFLAYMVRRLLLAALFRKKDAISPLEDRDHYANKRLYTTGSMMIMQFQTALQRLIKDMRVQSQKKVSTTAPSAVAHLKPAVLSLTMTNAIGGNKWGIRGNTKLAGSSQLYERHNIIGAFANARKVTTPVGDGGRILEPRHLHASHLGIIDPADTPEGKSVGLSKVIALTCICTVGSSADSILAILREINSILFLADILGESANIRIAFSRTKILVNGDWVAVSDSASEVVDELRSKRRGGCLSHEISIVFDTHLNEVRIWTDAGRLMRPLFIVEGGELLFTSEVADKIRCGEWNFSHLLANGIVEFLDKDEEDFGTLIVEFPSKLSEIPRERARRVSHCDIHPSLMYGVSSAVIPFPDHNQAPRNTYQNAMSKQAMGMPRLNIDTCFGSDVFQLWYPQVSLVKTRSSDLMHMNDLPTGINAIVGILPYLGFGEEDSVILNRDSVDRGLFEASKILNYKVVIRASSHEELAPPTLKISGRTRGRVSKLDADGIVAEGDRVENGDILVYKISRDLEGKAKDESLVYEEPWPSTVRRVAITTNADGFKCIRLQLFQRRTPIVGDKMAARCAQKGTIGAIVPACDLPFDSEGISPDIIFNPLGHPKRMTIAYFLEVICGKTVVTSSALRQVCFDEFLGIRHPAQDATPFRPFDRHAVIKELRSNGFDGYGDTQMTNGITGEPMKCLIYMGPIYYQRLKHCAIDKLHSRATGPITAISHQPTQGKEYDGGLRTGEMERDTFAAAGAAGILKDRLMEQSDQFPMWICDHCGVPALVEEFSSARGPARIAMCRQCDGNDLTLRKLPYGSKLFTDELAAMGIVVRMF